MNKFAFNLNTKEKRKLHRRKAFIILVTENQSHYIVTNRKVCFDPWDKTTEETIEFLLEKGHKRPSIVECIHNLKQYDLETEEMIDEELTALACGCAYYDQLSCPGYKRSHIEWWKE